MEAVLDPSFEWDGTRSDLAQQFYRAHVALRAANKTPPAATRLAHDDLPSDVRRRLSGVSLRFEMLPSLLQRALLWDTGYVFGEGAKLLRVFTAGDKSMAEIAVSMEVFVRDIGCSANNCTSQYRSLFCNGRQILSVANCVTDDVSTQVHSSVWATGTGRAANAANQKDPVIPSMELLQHQWVDTDANLKEVQYMVYGIHTVPQGDQPGWKQCPAAGTSQATGLTIPCGVYRAQGNRTRWRRPPHGKLVDKWLDTVRLEMLADNSTSSDVPGNDERSGVTIMVVLIVCGVLVVLAVFMACGCCWKRRRAGSGATSNFTGMSHWNATSDPSNQRKPRETQDEALETYHSSWTPKQSRYQRQQPRASMQTSDDDPTMMNAALRRLVDDANLADRRIPFEDLTLERQVSKGAFGEVWLATLHQRQVAVKRVRQDKRVKYQDLDDFSSEIQLTASLDHRNLVQFIGAAWMSPETLCMVTEYMANGDLQNYLHAHADTLGGFWTAEKAGIAVGVARALAYLHSLAPGPLIHRDVKAKNVLLDQALSPRLMDFGVSRQRQVDLTMTAGVGTPFWTAPEIVEGVRYSERSDIYSFGVLLTELETCMLPYHDQHTRQDLQYEPSTASDSTTPGSNASVPTSLRPFLILNLVMNGSLRPSFSRNCPDWLRELGAACVHRNPEKRPSAQHLVEVLARQWSMVEQ